MTRRLSQFPAKQDVVPLGLYNVAHQYPRASEFIRVALGHMGLKVQGWKLQHSSAFPSEKSVEKFYLSGTIFACPRQIRRE